MQASQPRGTQLPFVEQYGPWAVIAGASTGIGLAFAHALAARKLNLVILARDGGALASLERELRARYGIDVEARAVDLASEQANTLAQTICDDFEVGLMVMVAAEHAMGEYTSRDRAEHQRVVDVNIRAALNWSHAALARMRMRQRGGVIFMSSMTSQLAGPYLSTHVASKAFLTSLAEALYEENRERGVHVLGVLPGATDTPRYRAMNKASQASAAGATAPEASGFGAGLRAKLTGMATKTSSVMSPAMVVGEALGALGHEPTLIPGRINRLQIAALRQMPRKALLALMAKVMQGMELPGDGPATADATAHAHEANS